MFEVIKKAMFMGLGLATLSREKLEELSKEVAAKANLTEKQAAEFRAELEKKAEQARADFEAGIDRRMDTAIGRLGVAAAKDLSALATKVEELANRIENLEAANRPAQS
jgi:polyhydroxyalkanoate synthesis regulator phasin